MVEEGMATVSDDLRWTPDLTSRHIDVRHIEDVAFTPMPARLRNELITRTYGDVAQAMAEVLGTNDATWAGFGQWASKTIALVLAIPIPGFRLLVRRAFGDGNRDVFADIARAHAIFLETVGQAHLNGESIELAWDRCELELHRRRVKPSGSPGGGSEGEFSASNDDPRGKPEHRFHNQLLVIGFRAYYRAINAEDPEEKSQHILLGNCLLALHEQKLLGLALSVGLRSSIRTLTTPQGLLEPRHSWRHRDPGGVRLAIESAWLHFATKRFAGVNLPTGVVWVGKSVPLGDRPVTVPRVERSAAGSMRFARLKALDRLDDQTILGQLFDMFAVDGSPAHCWNTLDDRMAYILALFAQQQRASYWFDEQGQVVRAKEERWFQTELTKQVERLRSSAMSVETASEHVDAAPLSDDALDQLRCQPTHIEIGDNKNNGEKGPRGSNRRNGDAQKLAQLHADRFAERYAMISQPGQHLDQATCSATRQVFARWSTLWFMGVLFRSLPDTSAGATGVHAIARLADAFGNSSLRSGQSARFLGNLLRKDSGWKDGRMVPNGPAYRAILKLGEQHSHVANRLLADGWNVEAHGPPMNQEVALFTVLTYGVSPIAMFERLGIKLFPHWRDSYVRFWLGIGFLLGVPHEAITTPSPSGPQPIDYEQAAALTAKIRSRMHACSLDGVRMNEALLEGIADGLPRPCGWMASGFMTVLGEEEVNTKLLLGTGPGRRRADVLAAMARLVLSNRITRPLGVRAIRFIGRRWLRPLLNQAKTPGPRRKAARPDLWPTTCLSHEVLEEEPSPSSKDGRPGRRRRRLPQVA